LAGVKPETACGDSKISWSGFWAVPAAGIKR